MIPASSARIPASSHEAAPGGSPLPMHLVQILLPLADNHHRPFPAETFTAIKSELTEKFGGITAYTRSPAEGRWRSAQQEITDKIIIYEVMVESIDPGWWKDFRHKLQSLFRQEEIIIRALPQQLL